MSSPAGHRTRQRWVSLTWSMITSLLSFGSFQFLGTFLCTTGQAFGRADRAIIAAMELHRKPSSFAILTIFTVQQPWLSSEEAQLGLEYGLRGHSIYSLMHGYDHKLVLVGPPHERLNWNRVRFTLGLFQEQEGKLSCKHDWVVWMESDQFITNYNITLQSVLEASLRSFDGKDPDFIADIDAAGNLNTGVMFVRCSATAVQALNKLLVIKDENATDPRVQVWDHNGAVILLNELPEYKKHIHLAPPKLFNSYAWVNATGGVAKCPTDTVCNQGFWAPGDFLVHFAGAKDRMPMFLAAFPPETWIGYTTEYAAPVARLRQHSHLESNSWSQMSKAS